MPFWHIKTWIDFRPWTITYTTLYSVFPCNRCHGKMLWLKQVWFIQIDNQSKPQFSKFHPDNGWENSSSLKTEFLENREIVWKCLDAEYLLKVSYFSWEILRSHQLGRNHHQNSSKHFQCWTLTLKNNHHKCRMFAYKNDAIQ